MSATMEPRTGRDPAGTSKGLYHIPNALGQLWASAPRLAAKLSVRMNYAKAVQTYLRAVDFYCLQNGVSPSKVRVETTVEGDRIVQRIWG